MLEAITETLRPVEARLPLGTLVRASNLQARAPKKGLNKSKLLVFRRKEMLILVVG